MKLSSAFSLALTFLATATLLAACATLPDDGANKQVRIDNLHGVRYVEILV
jgi:hypothetical protein